MLRRKNKKYIQTPLQPRLGKNCENTLVMMGGDTCRPDNLFLASRPRGQVGDDGDDDSSVAVDLNTF